MPRTELQEIGRGGEERALAFLQRQGLTLVERNFLCKTGELDLVMRDGEHLVFVEVRERNNALAALPPAFPRPSSAASCVPPNITCCVLPKCHHAVLTWWQ